MARKWILSAIVALAAVSLWAKGSREPFQAVVDHVELERFLGSWYVIGVNPTVFEKGATNGIETYSLDPSGNVRVEYVFYKGSPEGKKVTMRQKGRVVDKTKNSQWEVQPLWPFWFPYLIIDLAEDYRYAVIGTNNYDNVWIMARSHALSERDYEGILARLSARGYKVDRIQRMRQSW